MWVCGSDITDAKGVLYDTSGILAEIWYDLIDNQIGICWNVCVVGCYCGVALI